MEISRSKSIGPKGLANIQCNKNVVVVRFLDGPQKGNVYELGRDQFSGQSGDYHVTLKSQLDGILGVRPTEGSYVVKFINFGNRQNEIPTPWIMRGGQRTRKDGVRYFVEDKLMFTANLEVIQPGHRFNGLKLVYMMPYIFTPATLNPSLARINGTTNELKKLEMFFRVAGVPLEDVDIQFSDTLLVGLEMKLQAADRPFFANVGDDTFIKDISPLPEHLRAGFTKTSAKKTAPKKATAKKGGK